MSSSLTGSTCTNCLRLAREDMDRGKYTSKYMIPGTYGKVSETNDQFSYGKAALGALVFGAVGAVAGINGKKTVTYRCDKCGHEITRKE